jgi:hypothetical protein
LVMILSTILTIFFITLSLFQFQYVSYISGTLYYAFFFISLIPPHIIKRYVLPPIK